MAGEDIWEAVSGMACLGLAVENIWVAVLGQAGKHIWGAGFRLGGCLDGSFRVARANVCG